jgi:serine/threonine-protein kinase
MTPPSEEFTPVVGRPMLSEVRFPGFRILKLLGRGGMAELFLANREGAAPGTPPVVIKRVLPHLRSSPQFLAMFQEEMRVASLVSHPNVVQILDLVITEGECGLVMEYLSGRSLLEVGRSCHARRTFVPHPVLAHVLVEVLNALEHAHTLTGADGQRVCVVHRDVTPDNIFVTYEGRVKLLDFGIAKVRERPSLTVPGTIKGKIPYMAPEAIQGQPTDARTDVYMAGVTLYEMMTHALPFGGRTEMDIAESVVRRPPYPPQLLNPAIPDPLVHICLKAMEKDPGQRFASAALMRAALWDWVQSVNQDVGPADVTAFMALLFPGARNVVPATRLDVQAVRDMVGQGSLPRPSPRKPPPEARDDRTVAARPSARPTAGRAAPSPDDAVSVTEDIPISPDETAQDLSSAVTAWAGGAGSQDPAGGGLLEPVPSPEPAPGDRPLSSFDDETEMESSADLRSLARQVAASMPPPAANPAGRATALKPRPLVSSPPPAQPGASLSPESEPEPEPELEFDPASFSEDFASEPMVDPVAMQNVDAMLRVEADRWSRVDFKTRRTGEVLPSRLAEPSQPRRAVPGPVRQPAPVSPPRPRRPAVLAVAVALGVAAAAAASWFLSR